MKRFFIFSIFMVCSFSLYCEKVRIPPVHQPVFSVPVKVGEYFILKNTNEVLDFVKDFLPVNPTIIDAGAYDGADSKNMAFYWPLGHIYAFEPVPAIYEILNKNIGSISNISTYELALSEKDEISEMFISEWTFDPGKPSASSSLLQPKTHLEHCNVVIFPKTIKVQTYKMDTWAKMNNINHIDMLWLDMQGVELNVLKASPKILSMVKVIWTEVEFDETYKGQFTYSDIKNWLEGEGFIMVGSDFNPYSPIENGRWYGNALFIRKEMLN